MSSRFRALGPAHLPWLILTLLAPRAGRPEEPPVFDLPEQVVRLPRAAGDETGAATVVEADRFAGEPKDVAALVATAPGVAVQEYGGLGQLATVSIRGASADGVKVLLDGLPLGSAAGGGVDLSTIPRAWVERIEVLRGAEGARFGQGALGGVVNVVTRRLEPGSWSARLAAGSFETGSAAADVAAGGERWGALLAAGADGTSGRFPYRFDDRPSLPGSPLEPRLRAHAASASGGLLAKGFARLAPGRLDLLAQVSAGDRQLPGSPYLQRPDNDDRMRESRAAASARMVFPVASGVLLAAEALGRADRLDLRLAPLAPVSQRELAGAARVATTWVAGPSLLEAGLSAGGDRLAAGGLGGTRSRTELAAWLAEELTVAGGRARLAPALRAERVGSFGGLSGKLGAAARLWGPLSARASAGRTFRAPSFGELYLEQGPLEPNPALRPEVGYAADAALVAEGRPGLASLGAFAALYDDLIVYLPASFGRVRPFNAARAGARGLEVELASAPLGPLGVGLQGSYTWLVTESLRGPPDVVGRELPHRARHRVYARASVAPGAFELHAELHAVARQWLDDRNLSAVPAARAVHAGGSVRLWRRPEAWLHLDVKNLGDDRTLQDGFGNPLPGRMAMVAVRVASGAHDEGGRR
ncbi:MAG TPA: TonB-dependent receptor [Anaeromyxobacteraceae bacterium]